MTHTTDIEKIVAEYDALEIDDVASWLRVTLTTFREGVLEEVIEVLNRRESLKRYSSYQGVIEEIATLKSH